MLYFQLIKILIPSHFLSYESPHNVRVIIPTCLFIHFLNYLLLSYLRTALWRHDVAPCGFKLRYFSSRIGCYFIIFNLLGNHSITFFHYGNLSELVFHLVAMCWDSLCIPLRVWSNKRLVPFKTVIPILSLALQSILLMVFTNISKVSFYKGIGYRILKNVLILDF